jgi:hypothetical protein
MRAQNSRRVFLSHTRADKVFARRLTADLESLGFSVWFDEWELRVGDSLIERVESGIEASHWMIVVLSPAAIRSQWVLKELRSGLTKEIGSASVFVLPALCRRTVLPSFIRDKFYADFTKSYETGLSLIKDRLIGRYTSGSTDEWLLIRNPLPPDFRTPLREYPRTREDTVRFIYGESYEDYDSDSRRPVHPHNVSGVGGERWISGLTTTAKARRVGHAPKGSELWFGRSGRLVLRRNREGKVSGDYDWHGMSLAGRIEGQVEKDCIVFSWNWSQSSERGRGLFWTRIPNLLYGGWWMDYEEINVDAIRSGRLMIPNSWEFVNVQGLEIVESEGV